MGTVAPRPPRRGDGHPRAVPLGDGRPRGRGPVRRSRPARRCGSWSARCGRPGTAGPLLAEPPGGADRVVPVARDVVDVGAAHRRDGTGGGRRRRPRVGRPPPRHSRRLHVVDDLVGRLGDARRLADGWPCPASRPGSRCGRTWAPRYDVRRRTSRCPATVLVRDARGLVHTLPLGGIGVRTRRPRRPSCPSGRAPDGPPPDPAGRGRRGHPRRSSTRQRHEPTSASRWSPVSADGQPVGGLEVLEDRSHDGDVLRAGARRRPRRGAGARDPGRGHARGRRSGDTLAVTVAGRSVPLTVVGRRRLGAHGAHPRPGGRRRPPHAPRHRRHEGEPSTPPGRAAGVVGRPGLAPRPSRRRSARGLPAGTHRGGPQRPRRPSGRPTR